MSVIAARKTKNKISVAADSILIKDDIKKTNFNKLVCVNGMIAGGCGSAEELSLFFMFIAENEPESCDCKGIMMFLNKFARWKCNYNNNDVVDNCYIIAYQDKLFESDGLFVLEVEDYTAIGEGEDFALAALHLGHTVTEAVECAAALSCSVSEPVFAYYKEI